MTELNLDPALDVAEPEITDSDLAVQDSGEEYTRQPCSVLSYPCR